LISCLFGASNGLKERSQRSQAVLDIFLSRDLPFPSMIEGKVESKTPTRPAQPKTKFLLSHGGLRLDGSKARRIFPSEENLLEEPCPLSLSAGSKKSTLIFPFLTKNRPLGMISKAPLMATGTIGAGASRARKNPPRLRG